MHFKLIHAARVSLILQSLVIYPRAVLKISTYALLFYKNKYYLCIRCDRFIVSRGSTFDRR